MKKSHFEKREVNQEIFEDIICNMCGESCLDSSGVNYEGLLEVSVCGGYASELGDGNQYTFSICECCLEKMFDEFKIKPSV